MKFLVYCSVSFLVAIFLASLSKFFFKSGNSKNKKRLPPGRMGLPWIGETIDFYKAQKKNKLYEDFIQARIRKHGPTFKTSLMGHQTVVVNGAESNKFFLSNEFKLVVSSWPSSSVQLMGENSIMEKRGEAHRCLRGIVASSLSPSGMEALVPRICSTVIMQLGNLNLNGGEKSVKLYDLTKVLTFTIVLECLLGIGVEAGMLEMFERVLEGVFAAPVSFPGSKFWRAKKARKEIERMLVEIIRKKREEMEKREEREGEGILLSRLVAALIRGEISEAEVADNVVLLVFAAHDTTSFAIAMTFRMLAHHPDCYSTLLKEHQDIMSSKDELTFEDLKKMKYTWQVARESMRIFPPIFGSFRKAIQDIEYDGYTIPKGWKVRIFCTLVKNCVSSSRMLHSLIYLLQVLWTAYGTHYDPKYFEDPMSFNPGRFDDPIQAFSYVPFGGGPRLCAGYQLAKLNILIFVHYFVTRYDWYLECPDEPISVDPLPFPSQGMPIRISPKLP
ncbi:hypothetical protein ACS0TY_017243 [Phlomoides rotata]